MNPQQVCTEVFYFISNLLLGSSITSFLCVAGMDPVSRRFVWNHIDQIKEDRVIALITHSMEESDLLSDNVAIVRKGELAAFGSPLELKAEHGSALQFSILVDEERILTANETIKDFFSDASDKVKIESSDTGTIDVQILSIEENDGISVQKLTDFVKWLDSKDSPVKEYGFSNSSLEEVFLKTTGGDQDEWVNDSDNTTVDAAVDDLEVGDESQVNDISSFMPNLSMSIQISTLFWDFWTRSWSWGVATGNIIIYGCFVVATCVLGFGTFYLISRREKEYCFSILILFFCFENC